MFSLNGTLKKVGRSGDGKRNNLLGWPFKLCLTTSAMKDYHTSIACNNSVSVGPSWFKMTGAYFNS